jgi:hypothetical protein
MVGFFTTIAGLLALAFLFPEEMLVLIRRLRRRLEEDIRRRVRPEEWERIEREFDD